MAVPGRPSVTDRIIRSRERLSAVSGVVKSRGDGLKLARARLFESPLSP
jgi:hypothetical protein